MKQFLGVILVGIMMVSCKNRQGDLSSEQIFQQKMERINWKSLDTYPSFEACIDYDTQLARKQCFEKTISAHIFDVLAQHKVVLKDSIHEKIELTVLISDKGKPSITHVSMSKNLEKHMPHIKEWLAQAMESLPKIYPAEKRGIPVSSKFKLPLVIVSE